MLRHTQVYSSTVHSSRTVGPASGCSDRWKSKKGGAHVQCGFIQPQRTALRHVQQGGWNCRTSRWDQTALESQGSYVVPHTWRCREKRKARGLVKAEDGPVGQRKGTGRGGKGQCGCEGMKPVMRQECAASCCCHAQPGRTCNGAARSCAPFVHNESKPF